MSRVDWPRVDASLAELLDPAAIDAAVDEGLRLGDLRFRRTLRLLQAVAVTAVVVVTGAALMLQGSVHAESEHPPPPPSHALPVVQSVFPAAGSHEGGLTVSVRGLHLGDVDTVFFGDTAVSDLEKVSDDAVFVVTPAHEPGPVPVTVVAGGEKSRANPSATFTFLPTSAAPGPRLTELSPDSGPDTGGTEVTVWGSRLDGASAVSFGESRVGSEMFLAASDTSITLRTPSRDAGPVEVTVTTDAGTSGPLTYTYTGESPPGPTDEIPVVKSVDPTSGSVDGGEKVTVSGANLADATAVEFGGVGATITSQDEGMITVLTPEQGAGEVAVVVKSPAGESVASPAARYTYEAPEVVPPPEVTGIEPDEGPTAGLQLVTIRGSGLAQATSVVFGGTEVTELGSSESSITLITPEHRPGPVEVRQTHGRVRLRRALQEAAAGAWSVPEADLAALVHTSRVLPTVWLNPGLADENGTRLTTPDVWLDDVGMAVMIHSREFHAGALQWNATVVDDSELSSHRIVVVGVTPEQLAKDPASVLRRIENHYVTARRSGFRPSVVATPRPAWRQTA